MISLHHVTKTYETPAGKFAALTDIDLEIAPGQFVGGFWCGSWLAFYTGQ